MEIDPLSSCNISSYEEGCSLDAPSCPKNTAGISSIEKAPPRQNPLFRMARMPSDMERVLDRQLDISEEILDRARADLDKIEEEKEKAFKKHAEKVASSDSWGTLVTVAQVLGGTGAVVSGVALGGWVGGALASLGVAQVVHKTVGATVGWRWAASCVTDVEETQDKIVELMKKLEIPLACGIAAFGGIAVWQSWGLAQGATLEKVGSIIATASGIFTSTAQFGQSFDTKEIKNIQADVKELEGQATNLRHANSETQQDIVRMLETNSHVTDTLRDAVLASMQH